jgi:hypothetical protein
MPYSYAKRELHVPKAEQRLSSSTQVDVGVHDFSALSSPR